MDPPTGHIHVSERETAPWICCCPCSGVMFARQAIRSSIPATLAEAHELRKAAGVPHSGGMSNIALRKGLSTRYGFTALKSGGTFAGLWTALPVGYAAAISGKMSAFPSGHRLRRFDPAFTGYHKTFIARMTDGDEAWWDDPLAPTGTYQGERVTKAEVEAFVKAAEGAAAELWVSAPIVGFADVAKFVSSGSSYGADSKKRLPVKAGMPVYGLDGKQIDTFTADAEVPVFGLVDAHSGHYLIKITTGKPYSDGIQRDTLALVKSAEALVDAPVPSPVPPTVLAPGVYEVQP